MENNITIEILKPILAAITAFIISTFLPKHIQALVRAIAQFSAKSIVKFWHTFILVFSILVFIIFRLSQLNVWNLLGILLLSIISTTVFSILLFTYKKFTLFNIAMYGCFSVRENDYLIVDIDSEELNQKINHELSIISKSHYSFKNEIVKVPMISLPDFIPILLGYRNLNNFIKKSLKRNNIFASLHFYRNVNSKIIQPVIYFNEEHFSNPEYIDNITTLFNEIANNTEFSNSKIIELSTNIYFLIFGQMSNDFLIDSRNFHIIHLIIDDSEKIISEIEKSISDLSEKSKTKIYLLLDQQKSTLERYRAIAFLEQKQYSGAIQHIFKSIKANPFYPYENYKEAKRNFNSIYGIEISNILQSDAMKPFAKDIDINKLKQTKRQLENQIKYKDATFNYEIVKEILRCDPSDLVIKDIEKELSLLSEDDVFSLITKVEILKYLKKGEDKFNEIYIERFDECINILRKSLKIDSENLLIKMKLGTLLIMKGFHFDNEKFIEQGSKEFKESIHILNQLGLIE